MDFFEPQTLIVVYKNELHVNQLKKLVETKDDQSEETAIGTTDGSVRIVAWTEKVWLDQKRAGNINNKVLFLGNLKGTDKLIPVIDIVFDEFGVRYGWAGNQAVLWIDPKVLGNEEKYQEFLSALEAMPVPKSLKTSGTTSPTLTTPQNQNFWSQLAIQTTNLALSVKDLFSNKKHLKEQMLFYGIINLYNKDLEKFMRA